MSLAGFTLAEEKTVSLGAPALGCCGTDRATGACLRTWRSCRYRGLYLNDCPEAKDPPEPFLVEVKRYRRGVTP